MGTRCVEGPEVVLPVGSLAVPKHLDEAVAGRKVVAYAVLPAGVGASEALVGGRHVFQNVTESHHCVRGGL